MKKFRINDYHYMIDIEPCICLPHTTINCTKMNKDVPDLQVSFYMGNDFNFSIFDFSRKKRTKFLITKDCLMYYPLITLLDGKDEFVIISDTQGNPTLVFTKQNDSIQMNFNFKSEYIMDRQIFIKNILEDGRSHCTREYNAEILNKRTEFKKIYGYEFEPYYEDENGIMQKNETIYAYDPHIVSKKTKLSRFFKEMNQVLQNQCVQTRLEI